MEKLVRDVMIPLHHLLVVDPTTSVAQARSKMRVRGVHAMVVKPSKGSTTWRIFAAHSLLSAMMAGGDLESLPINDFLTNIQKHVLLDMTVQRCLEFMQNSNIDICLVVDHTRKVVGIVGMSEIFQEPSSHRKSANYSRRPSSKQSTNNSNPLTTGLSKRKLKIFLCHASDDKPIVRRLYQKLRKEDFDPWLDEENLLPGQDWKQEISKAVKTSDIIIVCFSRKSVNKIGFVQKEIKYALDAADERPEGTIFLIPLKLEECEIPERMQRWQWVDGFNDKGQKRLIEFLRDFAEKLDVN